MSTIRPTRSRRLLRATASDSGYGSYAMAAGGTWTYTLDNSNAAVQALNVGGTLTDTFTVHTQDGTAQLVTITINGANDAAVIAGTTCWRGDGSRRCRPMARRARRAAAAR